MSRPHSYGTDDVVFDENSAGHMVLTTLESPEREGYIRCTARTAPDKERVWKRIDQQERRQAERMTEDLYNQRIGRISAIRSNLEQRKLASDVSNAEKDFIRESLKILDRKETTLNNHSVFGVSAMQQFEAPLPPSTTEKAAITPDAATE